MIKVFQILEEEKQEAMIVARKDERAQIVENLIKAGVDTLMIMKGTGLTKEEIEEIKKEYADNKVEYRTWSFTEMYYGSLFVCLRCGIFI